MKEQILVEEHDKKKRLEFYHYIHDNFEIEDTDNLEFMIETNNFPFVVDFKRNQFWVCASITCCACAAHDHKIISIEEFKKKVGKK